MSNAIRIVLTLACTVFLFLDGLAVHNLSRQFASCHYSGVSGRITDSKILSRRASKGGTNYSPYVSYTYQVGRQILFGTRLRYTYFFSSSYYSAQRIVDEYPAGSSQTIFYNPANPSDSLLGSGIIGEDFVGLLLLTPPNMVLLGLWVWFGGWLSERLFKPLAGGVKIIADRSGTRIRLPQTVALWWGLGTTGVLGLAAALVINFGPEPDASAGLVLSAIGGAYLAGTAVYGFLRWKAESGRYDLIIDESGHKLSLPPTYDRDERLTVNIANVKKIRVEKVEHRGSKGGITYTYAPTLIVAPAGIGDQKLADWSDKLKADDFSQWLSQKLVVPVESPPED